MSRVLRENRETEGKLRLARQRFARGWRALVVLVSAGAACSCLATNEFDFPTVDSLPELVALNPPDFARVANYKDADCVDIRDAMAFSASVYEPVPGQSVFVRFFVNGSGNADVATNSYQLLPNGTEQRATYSVCLPHALLNLPCNRVQLVAAHKLNDLGAAPVDGVIAPPYSRLEWTVLGKAKDNPDAIPSDCSKLYQQDAGAAVPLPDGGMSPPPADGGTLLPIDSGALFPLGSTGSPNDGGP